METQRDSALTIVQNAEAFVGGLPGGGLFGFVSG
jgi:hypothetical protein